MEQLLSYACYELDCYLDELKGNRRGEVSKKRKIVILVLAIVGIKLSDIAKTLNKDISSIKTAFKKSTMNDKVLAENIILNYSNWLNRRYF